MRGQLRNCQERRTDAKARLGDNAPPLRLANLMQLGHNLSIDLYVEKTVARAKLVVVRLLGGLGYWRYGVEQVAAVRRKHGILLAFVPGDDTPDPELAAQSTVGGEAQHRLWQYYVQGGPDNADNFLRYAAHLLGAPSMWREPIPLLKAGLYAPGMRMATLEDIAGTWRAGAPVVPIVFYRALVQAGDTAPIDALIVALTERGANPLPIYVGSLKDSASATFVEHHLAHGLRTIAARRTGGRHAFRSGGLPDFPSHLVGRHNRGVDGRQQRAFGP